MNDKTALVDCKESLSIKVREFLLSKGFDSASETPITSDAPVKKAWSLDIMSKDPEAKPRKCLFGLITLKPRQEHIGTVRFSKRADSSTHLVFEVYSHNHIYLAKQLANEMALNFNTKIVLLHVRGQLGLETYNVIKYYGV